MMRKISIIILVSIVVLFAISIANISSAMPGPNFDLEANERSNGQAYLISFILILIAYCVVLPIVVLFWKRKYGPHLSLKELLKTAREQKGSKFGVVALIFGIISICSFWWSLIPSAFSFWVVPFSVFLMYGPIPFSFFAVILCSFNRYGNKLGDLGLKLSVAAFLFSIIIFSATIYVSVS